MKRTSKHRKNKLKLPLILLYIGVVLIPGGVLGALALRALDREEAYVEKTLANSLLSEVTRTVSAVQDEMDSIRKELYETLAISPAPSPYPAAPLVDGTNHLIDVVFVLSEKKEILWPNGAVLLSEKEKEFLYWNAPLILDRVTIPVVKSIVSEYKDKILPSTKETAVVTDDKDKLAVSRMESTLNLVPLESTLPTVSANRETDEGSGYDNATRDAAAPEEARSAFPDRSATTVDSAGPSTAETTVTEAEKAETETGTVSPQKSLLDEALAKRKAAEIFENNPPIQDEIYKQAEEEGKEVLQRNTTVSGNTDAPDSRQRSLFFITPHTFSDIIAGGSEGFIPRFLGDEFSLLYWKKTPVGVVGCVVNMDALRERILSALPETTNEARILVVLDDTGKPLQAPQDTGIDWRLPFVSREIAENLPRWEVGVYLSDPAYISSRAEATTSVIWVLTGFLLFAIAGGGVIVMKMLLSELALAQKKTNLVTNVSHELKTPLTSIRLFAEMLMADIAPSRKKRKEYCTMLVSETERLSRLINNVLDFSKMSQGKKHYDKTDLELVALVREIIEREKVRLEQEGISLRLLAGAKSASFHGCRESLTQVLVNLISNAEKYASSGGEIDVSLKKKAQTLILDVADRGPGIPSWAAKRIFHEFFRVDDSLTVKTSGSGLGLTIVRMIVRDHGGEIEYLPRDGGGSVFRITFPERRKT